MGKNGDAKPTQREWADANLTVTKREWPGKPDLTIIRLIKKVVKGGREYEQSVCMNVRQLRAVARDHAS